MVSKLNISRILDLIIGRQCWHPYIDSYKSWAKNWTGNNES